MFNKSILFAVLAMVLSTVSAARAFEADPKNSTIQFKIDNGIGYTVGYFEKYSASVETDGDRIISAKAVIDMDSVNTRNSWHNEGLRSPLFLDTAKFPQSTFESSKIDGDQLTGTLTIKGIARPVTLTVGLNGGVFTAKGSFDRGDFGINFNRILKNHEKAMGDKVDLLVELVKQ